MMFAPKRANLSESVRQAQAGDRSKRARDVTTWAPAAGEASAATPSLAWDLSSTPIVPQKKLALGSVNDPLEREADQVADRMMRTGPVTRGAPQISRKCAECEEDDRGIQRKAAQETGVAHADAPAMVDETLRSSGQPLDSSTRAFFEPRFGVDFSKVRIHADSQAGRSARSVQAAAYTVGEHVVFAPGHYAPGTESGRRLLAHELTHVVQQTMPGGDSREGAGAGSTGAGVLHRAPAPVLMRTPLFNSTIDICHRVLKSRVFHVSEGGIVVTSNAHWEASPEWKGDKPPECGEPTYHIQLSQEGKIWDTNKQACSFPQGGPITRNWTNLPVGDYYLTISVNNTNPNCCLRGTIEVAQQSGLKGESCGGGPEEDLTSLAPAEKISRAIDLALDGPDLKAEAKARLRELVTPEALAAMAAFTAAYVISQTTPIGWVADLFVGGLVAATVLMVGKEAIEIVKLILEFVKVASNATSKEELDTAATLFARVVTKVGVDIIVAILFHKAGKALDLKPPGPRSPGLIEVLKVGGGKLSTAIFEPAPFADLVTANGEVIRVPIEKPANVLMSEAQKPAGGPAKGSGGAADQPTGAGSKSAGGAEPPAKKPPGKLPGKSTVAAEGLSKNAPPSKEPAPGATEEPGSQKKESGTQQEKRLLDEDGAGRQANSATYHAYEGNAGGSFRKWVGDLQTHINKTIKDPAARPTINEAPLAENTHSFINRHPNLKAAWEQMSRPLDEQLELIQKQRSAAAGDKAALRGLDIIEEKIIKLRTKLAEFETGDMGNKRPDLLETFLAEHRAVVTDITQATGDAFHNFKTQCYIDLIKEVLGWSDVNGVNFNTVYDQNIAP